MPWRLVLEYMAKEWERGMNCCQNWASQVALVVRNPLPMKETQETQIRFLGQEDPLEEGMATHSRILAWRILWIEETGGLRSMGWHRVRHN